MPCCIIAFALIIKLVIGWENILSFLGIKQKNRKTKYNYSVYSELDEYKT